MKTLRSPFRSRSSADDSDGVSLGSQEKDGQDSRYLTNNQDIIACLKTLRDKRTSLKLRLENPSQASEQVVVCKILDVTPTGFLIEDISPRSALALMHTGPAFSISARDQGNYAFIEESQVLHAGEERGVPYFHGKRPGIPSFLSVC